MIELAGVDLAWQGSNTSAVARGQLRGNQLTLTRLLPALADLEEIYQSLTAIPPLTGIAIDAPLIIKNAQGMRQCERDIGRRYHRQKIACHASNLGLYPDARSVTLAQRLAHNGFAHLGDRRWQLECYPHPALVEIFQLEQRLEYKKGKVAEKKAGQIQLADRLQALQHSDVLQLQLLPNHSHHFDPAYIERLKGQALKVNEDALDAIVCLYIAGLYQLGYRDTFVAGDAEQGYIYVPAVACHTDTGCDLTNN